MADEEWGHVLGEWWSGMLSKWWDHLLSFFEEKAYFMVREQVGDIHVPSHDVKNC
jgi:hypothetical protein